jgi:hypothetical protein
MFINSMYQKEIYYFVHAASRRPGENILQTNYKTSFLIFLFKPLW